MISSELQQLMDSVTAGTLGDCEAVQMAAEIAVETWSGEILALAEAYWRQGRSDENDGIWDRAQAYRTMYTDLCALVGRLDPRPGAGNAPARPW